MNYRVNIDALSGDITQTMHTEIAEYDGTPQQLAEDTAQNQNIAEGENWIVRVYSENADSQPLAEAGPGARGYYTRIVTAVEADDKPVTITVNASPTDDPRVMLDLSGTTDRPGYPLIEILAIEPDQVDALIEALQGARDYLRGQVPA